LGLLDDDPKRRAVARFDPFGRHSEIHFHGSTTSLGFAEWGDSERPRRELPPGRTQGLARLLRRRFRKS
jgi:hypothetical protein